MAPQWSLLFIALLANSLVCIAGREFPSLANKDVAAEDIDAYIPDMGRVTIPTNGGAAASSVLRGRDASAAVPNDVGDDNNGDDGNGSIGGVPNIGGVVPGIGGNGGGFIPNVGGFVPGVGGNGGVVPGVGGNLPNVGGVVPGVGGNGNLPDAGGVVPGVGGNGGDDNDGAGGIGDIGGTGAGNPTNGGIGGDGNDEGGDDSNGVGGAGDDNNNDNGNTGITRHYVPGNDDNYLPNPGFEVPLPGNGGSQP
ncbi:hypothetical protein Scep_011205 [Stephania cephalantha]|uniref:Uncharacterized protein n=1 Tax=Stephania cephalantha TaxID=152367 RepID=A0AAP0P5C3_9MAGN